MHILDGTFRSLTRSAVLLGILGLSRAVAVAQNPNSSGIAVLEAVVTDPSGVRAADHLTVCETERQRSSLLK